MNKVPFLKLVIGVVILFLVVVIVFCISPSLRNKSDNEDISPLNSNDASTGSDSTALQKHNDGAVVNFDGTKLYRNEKWGFEFKYPGDWIVNEPAFGSAVSLFNMEIVPPVKHYPHPIRVNILPNNWIEKVRASHKAEGKNPIKAQIGGIEAEKYAITSEGLPESDYFFSRGSYWVLVGGKDEYKETLGEVLSTFRFFN